MMRPILFMLLALIWAAPAAGQSVVRNPHTTVELLAEKAAPAPGAKTTLAIRMTPSPGWHTYWKNPGGAGLETRADWTLPAGVSAGPLRYPVPSRFLVSGIMNYVYKGPSALLADLKVGSGLAAGTSLPVRLKLDYLVCDDKLCVPESATLALDLTVGAGQPDPALAAFFEDSRAALPKPVDWPARYERDGERLRLSVTLARPERVTDAYFFPVIDGALDYAAPQRASLDGDRLVLETDAPGTPSDFNVLPGVLSVFYENGSSLGAAITAAPGEVASGGLPLARPGEHPPGALIAFGFAVLGGLLLNIMPCVFPILGLKALSLARSGESEGAARVEALAYTAGTVLSCLALGGVILALRAAGEQVGWAFQLQNPRIILALLLLMSAVALNLAGLFEIPALRIGGEERAARPGSSGAFWTGVLAAVVATPCTGPFMGVALGAAILMPPLTGLIVFGGLGLGLALPFLALAFIPPLRRRLPRPGPWLITFRRILAVPMFAAAFALAWVLGRQTGTGGLILGLGGVLLLGLALWWLGLRQQRGARAAAPLAIAAAAAVAVIAMPPAAPPAASANVAALPGSVPFSGARLAALRSERRPVFLYFTADWCITCKVNENGALASARVRDTFDRAGVVTMVGDWTNADAEITRFLESRGRAGVPLYLFYDANGGETVLPQILDEERLLALVAPRA